MEHASSRNSQYAVLHALQVLEACVQSSSKDDIQISVHSSLPPICLLLGARAAFILKLSGMEAKKPGLCPFFAASHVTRAEEMKDLRQLQGVATFTICMSQTRMGSPSKW